MSSSGAGRAALYAVIVLVFVTGAAFLFDSQVGGLQVYDVYPTNSMQPTLEVGDLVIVHSVPYDSIQVGQVMVFDRPNLNGGCTSEVIVHRVYEVTSQGLITWGDNRYTNPRPDEPQSWPPVTVRCVRGIVVLAVPYLGKISEVFPPPTNYLLVAIIIVVIFLSEFLGGRKRPQSSKEDGATPASRIQAATPHRG